ncbi:UDP-2,3-diacylglucosamine diphosphatase [Roseateles saccharophilus]|uniref:UDP-2,3-diacylglucosamine hydrolase n=1 Tax=Roseateles saccharophilus TaxID=304 RepID=A0A4R3VJG4_ROSSA|nr:UDP-2,3-diacylglucosamine diphosphatase [Roseateles saccharophilus]MDG0832513.1 UDP-2,3-diacylglucosamine diphosphatase [Roseateles saccharophilus]TCV03974.1 UDP-2,3-diacylglucosamine hydrolase [Roseateles saccharophilus]
MIHTLTAPKQWQQIDLLSDLHLGPDTPGTFARLERHLAETPAQAVLLLGDIFEVWVGDDSRHLPFEAGCAVMLKSASQRLDLFFMHGNRDFLLGTDMLAACGMTALPDPTVLAAFGQQWLLVHGDAQCLADTAYQLFRNQVRSPHWQAELLAQPLEARQALGRQMREGSRAAQAAQLMASDLDADVCRALLDEAGAKTMIHGHTHRPAEHDLGNGRKRVVLSDWDFDGMPTRGDVIRLSPAGLQRIPL